MVSLVLLEDKTLIFSFFHFASIFRDVIVFYFTMVLCGFLILGFIVESHTLTSVLFT